MADIEGSASPKRVPLNESADLSAPLRGCVICCTSVPDEKRTEIAQWTEQMGGVHRYDLTLDVTHLIVADYNTDKYRYVARERQDVQPMTIQWIESVRELWMNDKEIDFTALETEYRLPTFHTLRFSMTGCDDPQERLEIAEQVKANGATYEGDLTKQITHLISFRTEGAKYKAAKNWKLKIVSAEWLRDSIERGMILDERLYDPILPIETRGIGAWDKTKPKRTSLGKRSREGSAASLDGGRRKLRRTASTKLSSQSANIWGDIVGGGSIAQVSRSGVWDTAEDADLPRAQETRAREPIAPPNPSSMQSTIENPSMQGMFSGCRFYVYGFVASKEQILRGHLISNGGEVSDTIEALVDTEPRKDIKRLFRIVPHDLPGEKYPLLPDSQLDIETITFWWVERCLHNKWFLEPSESIIGQPFPTFPILGFNEMTISSSAFTGIDLLHFKKAVELIGAKYSEDTTPQSTVLVTKSVIALRHDKSECAQIWNVPIVTADWLWDCIKSGQRLPYAKYKLRLTKKRAESIPNVKERPSSRASTRPERSKSEILKPITASSSGHSSNTTRPPRNSGLDVTAFADDGASSNLTRSARQSGLDETAFADDEPDKATRPARTSELDTTAFQKEVPSVKDEQVSQVLSFGQTSSTEDIPIKAPPLSERSINSPTRTTSTASAPSEPPPPSRPSEEISNAISCLLAKSKSAAAPAHTDPSEGRRRGGNRILGRVTSNVSTASANRSRATSVDSTASHGHPVQYPSYLAGKTANDHIDMLVNGDRQRLENLDSQPSSTQVQYDDPESTTAREIVMARMNGEKIEPKRAGLKEKAATIGGAGARTTRRTARTPGFR
ncbi:uncharacterized protein LY89DRAFT_715108 [Mollisia scopiformis]|uniref:BRCT domain-containing protein n=1 Tax=Mollisia scopiformis TaxID=149040 RepID=A0A194XPE7_MOLSC|nr:uncharacterized protein LY89DRAFT_715108 [Mollisia scopiformis]KUJ22125.1 hypothetical protein LY89DRAFT_715108 [Mollisia scopiformis]